MEPDEFVRGFDAWIEDVRDSVGRNEGTIAVVNSMMVVATFVAGVQAQMITLTKELPGSALGRTANFFAFIGLMLSISGTFLGALHAISLQRKIQVKKGLISFITQCKADVRFVVKAVQEKEKRRQDNITASNPGVPDNHRNAGSNNSGLNLNLIPPEPQLDHAVHESMSFIFSFISGLDERSTRLVPPSIYEILGQLIHLVSHHDEPLSMAVMQPLRHARQLPRRPASVPQFTSPSEFGTVPLMLMAGAVVCLGVSTILLPAASKDFHNELWIGCVAVLVCVLVLVMLSSLISKHWVIFGLWLFSCRLRVIRLLNRTGQ